jgi:pentapeptide MXKDX repeat protein
VLSKNGQVNRQADHESVSWPRRNIRGQAAKCEHDRTGLFVQPIGSAVAVRRHRDTSHGAERHRPQENIMARTTLLPAAAFALASIFMFGAGPAAAEDAMKPATETMSSDAMKPADPMAADAMKAECMEKAGMETDAMKKEEAMKACDDMAMKGDAMKPAADAMKPATSN